MLICQNSTQNLISDVRENLLADKMRENFEESSGKRINPSEFRSWENSLRMMREVIELAELHDNNIAMQFYKSKQCVIAKDHQRAHFGGYIYRYTGLVCGITQETQTQQQT